MINEAKQRLTGNKVFPKNVREELRAYNFTGISEETEEFLNLQNIFQCLIKKTDAEKFYSMFYSTVPIKSTSYFAGLSRNAATLLSTKLADHMLSYSKKQECTNSSASSAKLTEKEMAGLQYIGGYVLNKLHHKHAQSKSSKLPESQQAMSILKAGRKLLMQVRSSCPVLAVVGYGQLLRLQRKYFCRQKNTSGHQLVMGVMVQY